MDAITSTFHIDIKLIVAQLINFAIVLFLVYFVLGKPLIKMMHKRDARIKEGIDNADKADLALSNAEKEKESVLASAREEARGVVTNAHDKGKKIIDEAKVEGVKAKNDIVSLGAKEVERNRSEVQQALKKETAHLVRKSLEKVLEDGFTSEDTERLMRSAKV